MLGTHVHSAARCVSRAIGRGVSLLIGSCFSPGAVFGNIGLGEEDGCRYLALQGLQEDYCWRSMDCDNDCCCHRAQVRPDL